MQLHSATKDIYEPANPNPFSCSITEKIWSVRICCCCSNSSQSLLSFVVVGTIFVSFCLLLLSDFLKAAWNPAAELSEATGLLFWCNHAAVKCVSGIVGIDGEITVREIIQISILILSLDLILKTFDFNRPVAPATEPRFEGVEWGFVNLTLGRLSFFPGLEISQDGLGVFLLAAVSSNFLLPLA